ncbi:MAG: maleylacetate reductase [Proteobacteria bacterium]|nr:maleylacetate reductase [Pseudomonadota bacterium]
MEALSLKRALFLSTAGRRSMIQTIAEGAGADRAAGFFAEAEPHVPQEVAEAAMAAAKRNGADVTVALGGGSTIGLGKYIAVHGDIPWIAIPTTYSGSEMTPLFGFLKDGHKNTSRNLKALPISVIYDPKLTVGLPPRLTATSGMNGMAHLVEALYAQSPDPVSRLFAVEGIKNLAEGLRGSLRDPHDIEARTKALYGAMLGGSVVTTAGIAAHHRFCHVLGGAFGVPHGESNTVMLPQIVRFNAEYAPQAMEQIAGALGCSNAARGLYDLVVELNAPTSLKELGLSLDQLEAVADRCVAETPYNPAPVTRETVMNVMRNAYEGIRP